MTGPKRGHLELRAGPDDATIELVTNPTGGYDGVPNERLIEAGGFIPLWVGEAFAEHPSKVMERVVETYGFGGEPFPGHTVQDNGIKSYPGDPDEHPIFYIAPVIPEMLTPTEWVLPFAWVHKVYMYEHAWVNFVTKDADGGLIHTIIRMD